MINLVCGLCISELNYYNRVLAYSRSRKWFKRGVVLSEILSTPRKPYLFCQVVADWQRNKNIEYILLL